MNRKKLYYSISCLGLICVSVVISLLSGCAKEHRLKPIHFRPVPPPEIPSQELPPVATASPVQSIRIANAYFEEAQNALQKNDKKTAQEKYLTARRTLISAGIVPGIFRDLESWERDMLPESEKKINLQSMNTYKIIEGLKGSPPYSSIDIPFPVPERVLYEIEDAQTRYPDRFQEGLDRSGYYVPYIRESLKKAGLPQELCWLAMVESMYKLKAYSSAGAAGMWQFIRSTGEHYNMRIDSYIDERYNWVIATSHAIEYLTNLHNFFKGDWNLAISAYNMGEGALMRKIEANGGNRNFWTLIETPPASYEIRDETKKYLPRFLAYILICNDPVPYGFSPSPYQPIKWDEVEVSGMYALDALDRAMGYTAGTLSSWNPFLIRGTTPPTGCKLMIPAGDGSKLLAMLNNPSIKQAEVITYKVKKGETAYHIAQKYDISVNELLKINDFNSVKSVKAGMEIQVPLSKKGRFSFAKSEDKEAKKELEQETKDYHLVQKGETLFSIAKKYNIEVENLAVWNNMKSDQRLKVGDRISIKPLPSQNVEVSQSIPHEEEKQQTRDIYHVVKAGDTINSISKTYSTEPEKIMQMNNLSAKSILHIGQRLVVGKETIKKTQDTRPITVSTDIPKDNKNTEINNENKVHEIQKGDTLGKIASLYKIDIGKLKQWNKLDDNSTLKIGQKIYLYDPEIKENTQPKEEKSQGNVYLVKQGDTLSKIARENNTSIKNIMELNNLNENSNLQIGQKIILSREITNNKSNTPQISKEKTSVKENIVPTDFVLYRVQPGDNLWSIARKNNISVNELTQWNNLDTSKQLKIGQEIKIRAVVKQGEKIDKKDRVQVSEVTATAKPQVTPQQDKKQSKTDTYTVQKGDSLYTISKKLGISLKELKEINNFEEKKVLQVGEVIRIKK